MTNIDELAELAETTARVHDLLEEMAPDLMRINPDAAETAARIMIRLKARSFLLQSRKKRMT